MPEHKSARRENMHMLTVTTDFCGGNAVIHSVTEDTIVFEPDIRDTEGTWFYWQ